MWVNQHAGVHYYEGINATHLWAANLFLIIVQNLWNFVDLQILILMIIQELFHRITSHHIICNRSKVNLQSLSKKRSTACQCRHYGLTVNSKSSKYSLNTKKMLHKTSIGVEVWIAPVPIIVWLYNFHLQLN